MIKRFIKKPVEIEATQYTGSETAKHGVCHALNCLDENNKIRPPHLHTIHKGQMVNLEIGDYIIPEPDGKHFYPCKPDIFESTYDEVK